MPNKIREKFRVDFVFDVLSADDETRMMRIAMRPDPKRYRKVDRGDGKSWYLDKFTNDMFDLDSLPRPAVGTPLFYSPPKIDDASAYAKDRTEAVSSELKDGMHLSPKQLPDRQRALSCGEAKAITFISVDVCRSTTLRLLNAKNYDRALKVLIQEFVISIGHFHGSILKMTGDGFLAYFDESSFNTQCDNAVDSCLTLLRLLKVAINPKLKEARLPELHIRIGAEHGSAIVSEMSVAETGFDSSEVSSDALNRAAKIQEVSQIDELTIGPGLYALLHTDWLARAHEVSADISREVGIENYKLYQMR